MSFDDLRSWCQSKVANEADRHLPYVKRFRVDATTQESCFLLTTPKLEEVSNRALTIAVDVTYRVNWNGIPMFVAGIVDAAGSFRLTHAGLMSSEDEYDFLFLFAGILSETTTAVIADNAPAITSALERYDVRRINCWAHMIRAVDCKLRALPDREERLAIRSALTDVLQLATSPQEFERFAILVQVYWLQRGSDQARRFFLYFKEQWLIACPHWYEGYAHGVPSTNNGLESTNSYIKDSFFHRRRPLLAEALATMETMMTEFSRTHDDALAVFRPVAVSRTPTEIMMANGYRWLMTDQRSSASFFLPIDDVHIFEWCDDLHPDAKRELFRRRLETWETLIQFREVCGIIDASSRCNCRESLKNGYCVHSIAFQHLKGIVLVPEHLRALSIPQRRRRGRPRHVRGGAPLMRN